MKSVAFLPALAATAYATVGLLVPYYEYPTGDAATADWNALIQAIDAHPALPFYVVIDNNQGAPYSPNPPATLKDWASWLGQLNARPNVKTVGYIYTSSSSRDYNTVTSGVDQYASWTANPGWPDPTTYDVHIDGIFFDEIDTDSSKLGYNTNITNYAKSAFQSKGGPIVLNPGVPVLSGSESLFSLADAIVQIETCYTTVQGATDPGNVIRCPTGKYTPFTPSSLDVLGSDATRVGKSSVLVHDFYDSWSPYQPAPESTLQADVTAIVNKKVHSLFVSQYGYNGNFTAGPASVTEVAALAASAQGLA